MKILISRNFVSSKNKKLKDLFQLLLIPVYFFLQMNKVSVLPYSIIKKSCLINLKRKNTSI